MRKRGKAVGESNLETLTDFRVVSRTEEVWAFESGEGFSSFTLSYIEMDRKLRKARLEGLLLIRGQIVLIISKMFIKSTPRFKLQKMLNLLKPMVRVPLNVSFG